MRIPVTEDCATGRAARGRRQEDPHLPKGVDAVEGSAFKYDVIQLVSKVRLYRHRALPVDPTTYGAGKTVGQRRGSSTCNLPPDSTKVRESPQGGLREPSASWGS